MANKAAKQERFVGQRGHALAVMYLTRRSDLLIEEVREDLGLDLIVRFVPQNKEGIRQFGVELRGVRSSVTKEHADKVLGPTLRGIQHDGPFAFPVCLFFFTMEDNKGWYTWVAQPSVHAGKAVLRMHEGADCRPLDRTALDTIVDQVDRWYDVFFKNLITNAAEQETSRRRQQRN